MGSITLEDAIGQIDSLRVFSVMWAMAILFHLLTQAEYFDVLFQFPSNFYTVIFQLMTISCVVLLYRSTSIPFLLASAFTFSVYFLGSLPSGINHPIMFFLLNASILISYAWLRTRGSEPEQNRQKFYEAFSPIGRYLLIIMYIFGIFHKLNTGWFDPDVSCGVVVLNSMIGEFGLISAFTDWLAIYGTLIVEAIAIFFLCTPRYKIWGFAIGIPFHLLILTFPIAWFAGFSSMVLALYSFFLPVDFGDRLKKLIIQIAPYRKKILFSAGTIALPIYGFLIFARIYGPESGSWFFQELSNHAFWMGLHGLLMMIGLTYFSSIMYLCYSHLFAGSMKDWMPRPAILLLVAVLFFVNAISPYIGLKTDGTIAMFSNLHTEAGQTNHIFFDKPPYLFDYQNHLVEVISASPEFVDWAGSQAQLGMEASGEAIFILVEFEFWSYLHRNPSTVVTYRNDSGVHTLNPATDVLGDHPIPWLLGKIFTFKSVDFKRPKICTH